MLILSGAQLWPSTFCLIFAACIGIRYDVCEDDIRLRWNMPLMIPQIDVDSLVFLFKLGQFDGDVYQKIPFPVLETSMHAHFPNATIELEVKLISTVNSKYWPSEGLQIAPVYRITTGICGTN